MHYKIDVMGQVCPIPLIELKKKMQLAESGDLIELIVSDTTSIKDIPKWLTKVGVEHQVVQFDQYATICVAIQSSWKIK